MMCLQKEKDDDDDEQNAPPVNTKGRDYYEPINTRARRLKFNQAAAA